MSKLQRSIFIRIFLKQIFSLWNYFSFFFFFNKREHVSDNCLLEFCFDRNMIEPKNLV